MKISDLKLGSTVYLMGICGTAMASLAGLLKSMGYQVTGVDQNAYPPMSYQLESLGIQYVQGYSAENLKKINPNFVIVGNVISKNNPEVATLFEMNLPYTSLPCALGELFLKSKTSLVVSGTHGKTTTTSALAWVLDYLDQRPGFLIGGIPKNFESSFRLPQSEYFAIEGDEYDTAFFDKVPKFTHYHPKHAILTSIEFDHADIYASLDAIKMAFSKLVTSLSDQATLVYHGDDLNIGSILKSTPLKAKTISYGFSGHNDIQVRVLPTMEGSGFFEFELNFKSNHMTQAFKTQLFGEHNALNFGAVVVLCHKVLNLPLQKIAEALTHFTGVKRRQEILGQPQGITIIEDFAHHPTAVRETLKSVKARFPGQKVWAIFEPRSATSRRKLFQAEYLESFLLADEIILKEAFDQSKIEREDRFSALEVVQELLERGKLAHYFKDIDSIQEQICQGAQTGDVVVIMSNGGFDGIYQSLIDKLSCQGHRLGSEDLPVSN